MSLKLLGLTCRCRLQDMISINSMLQKNNEKNNGKNRYG